MSAFIEKLEIERMKPGITNVEFKRRAFELQKLAGGSLKLGNVHQLLAAAYGYATFAAAQAATVDGYIPRRVGEQ
jgi:hypothetical protein